MALNGKFEVNNADFSPLTVYGVGIFMAFSGNEKYRNQGGCSALPDNGPIPEGRYWIVDRPTGGIRSKAMNWAADAWNSAQGAPSNHAEWFALFRDDGSINDFTWINGVKRGNFRLHPIGGQGLSLGCITLQHRTDFITLRRALLRTSKVAVRNSNLKAYGYIEVVANDETCPFTD